MMTLDFANLVIIGGVFCILLLSAILFFWKKSRCDAYVSKLLSVALFSIGWAAFIYIIIMGGLMKDIPWLYGYGIPIYHLIPPFAYLYVRGVIYRESRLKKKDYLHLIPFAISLVAMLPFYFSGMPEKVRIANAITNNINNVYIEKTGLIPNIIYFLFRPLQGVIYLVPQWWLVATILFRPDHRKAGNVSGAIKQWLVIFTIFQSLIYLGQAGATVNALYHLSIHMDMVAFTKMPLMAQSLLFFFISMYILFTPEVVYGSSVVITYQAIAPADGLIAYNLAGAVVVADTQTQTEATATVQQREQSGLSQHQVLECAGQIETYLECYKVFRQQGISINDLAAGIKISPRTLSYIINQHYNQRFTDFINNYRVQHIKARIVNGDTKAITLEGLATDAGFSSRSAFFAAFKKNTGYSPTEYIQSLKIEELDAVPSPQLN